MKINEPPVISAAICYKPKAPIGKLPVGALGKRERKREKEDFKQMPVISDNHRITYS